MEANGIVLSPDPRLRQECAVIEEITPAIRAELDRLTVLDRMVYRLARAHWRARRGR